jgi:lysozyme family protein
MGDFNRCIDLILAEEGGYVHHPNDPGGETKFGISQRAYPHLDIARLTLADVVALYQRDYWTPMRGDAFPDPLALLLFDSAVNQGPKTAIRLLQKALTLNEDGLPGPLTIHAAQKAPPEILGHFCAERALRYEFHRNEEHFGRGWYRRLFKLYGIARSWQP